MNHLEPNNKYSKPHLFFITFCSMIWSEKSLCMNNIRHLKRCSGMLEFQIVLTGRYTATIPVPMPIQVFLCLNYGCANITGIKRHFDWLGATDPVVTRVPRVSIRQAHHPAPIREIGSIHPVHLRIRHGRCRRLQRNDREVHRLSV